jgi:hypothetical protein
MKVRVSAALLLAAAGIACRSGGGRARKADVGADEDAKRRVVDYLNRKSSSDGRTGDGRPFQVNEDLLVAVPLGGTSLEGYRAFALWNVHYASHGGCVFDGMYLVGSGVGVSGEGVTEDFHRFFEDGFRRGLLNVSNDEEAFEAARCYAWLRTRHPPLEMEILKDAELPAVVRRRLGRRFAESLAAQIVSPSVTEHRVATRSGRAYEVTLCTFHPASRCDVYLWRFEMGRGHFSCSFRPLYRGDAIRQ